MPEVDVIAALASVTEEGLRRAVEALAYPRHGLAQARENRRAGREVADRLSGLGYRVSFQGEQRNVVALQRGGGPARVLIGAHYDSVPATPGADDNASGTAAMLACAEALSGVPGLPVGFVAFNGEEDGLLGSSEFAAALGGEHSLEVVHILEMVGYCQHGPGTQRSPIPAPLPLPDVGDFIGLLGNQASAPIVDRVLGLRGALTPGLPAVALKTYLGIERWLPVLHRSDHSPFWRAGVPAVLWTDTAEFRNPHYHRPTDTPDRLDYGFMRRVTQLLLGSVLHDPALARSDR